MDNLVKTTINIWDLQQGMTVEHNGELITVSNKDIKHNELFGYSFRGDCSKKTITRVQFIVPTLKGKALR
jgi:hypothetical protein